MLKPGKAQQGRSMVEMVATMAIMALLGVVSISWFKGALAKQEAERDYEDIISTISALNNRGTARTDKGIADTFLTYNKTRSGKNLFILKACPTNTEAVTIKIDNIDERTCEYLMKKDWNKPYRPLFILRGENSANVYSWNGVDGPDLYRLTNVDDCTRTGAPEKGAFAVVFNDKRDNVVPCSEDTECGECEYCSAKGICENACTEGQTCAKEFETPDAPKECYPTDHIVDGVYCANPDGEGNCCDSKGQNCCPPDKPLITLDGVCRSCDDTTYNTVVNKTTNVSANCARCPNRELRSSWYTNEFCVVKECPAETPLQNYQGKCFPCDVQSSNYLDEILTDPDNGSGYNNSCSLCPNRGEVGYIKGHAYQCVICPGESYVGADGRCTCPPDKPLLGKDGCHSCDENVYVITMMREVGHACSVCPNRSEFWACCRGEVSCGLTVCSEDQIHDVYGVCRDCSQSADIRMNNPNGKTHFSPDSCNSCSGRYTYTDSNNNVTCRKCPTDTSGLTAEQRVECTNDCLVYNSATKIWENKCTKVEYLESTGTQYIDTGLKTDIGYEISCRVSPNITTNGWYGVFGVYYGSGGKGQAITIGHYDNKRYTGLSAGWGFGQVAYDTFTNYPRIDQIEMKSGSTTINGISIDTHIWTKLNETDTTFYLGATSNEKKVTYSIFRGRIYSFSIIKNGQKIIDFIPVLDPNGVPAMYDQVEKKLYYNAGSGTFSYGPAVN